MLFLATNVIEQAFSPLISLFEGVMVFLHGVLGSWGMAIVGLTVIVRAVMVPLTFRSLKSMQEMQRHAPEINALKEKYKDDKQRQQQEVMKYYQEMGINPLASCLPLVLQLPVFISLFYMLRSDLKLDICGEALRKHFHVATNSQIPAKGLAETGCNQVAPGSAKFLFIPDITAKATGIVLVVLITLYVASQLGSTLLMSASAEPSQRWMMIALPLFFVVILFRYPAGLLVYWITTNLWTVAQGYFVRRSIGAPPASLAGKGAAVVESGASTNGSSSGRGSPKAEPALAGAATAASIPPPPPRKEKKRSGRRR
jgi:YidC/Oxa1 family membrane protein insertase